LTPAEWDKYVEQIRTSKEKGYICESQLPYAALLVFVPKTQLDGAKKELRMVIDYRALNSVIVKDRFPLLLPEELIDHLQGKQFLQNKFLYWLPPRSSSKSGY
jgi:hypothetical protein